MLKIMTSAELQIQRHVMVNCPMQNTMRSCEIECTFINQTFIHFKLVSSGKYALSVNARAATYIMKLQIFN
jgi:hypothetical protein